MKACYAVLCLTLITTLVWAQSQPTRTTEALSTRVAAGRAFSERAGGEPNRVRIEARHADGSVFFRAENHNLRTNGGTDWQASVMGNTSAPPATCNYIGVSSDATAPAATDSALSGEIAANGLGRAQGAYIHSPGNNTFTVSKTFTASGSFTAVQKAGMFNAASGGTMCFESAFSSVNLGSGDTLSITWTVTLN